MSQCHVLYNTHKNLLKWFYFYSSNSNFNINGYMDIFSKRRRKNEGEREFKKNFHMKIYCILFFYITIYHYKNLKIFKGSKVYINVIVNFNTLKSNAFKFVLTSSGTKPKSSRILPWTKKSQQVRAWRSNRQQKMPAGKRWEADAVGTN